MKKIFSTREAESFFIENHLDSVIAVYASEKGDIEKVCDSYMEVVEFYSSQVINPEESEKQ